MIPDGDITKVDENNIPNHDILCAGFSCQAFSISGNQKGFEDSRGTLFFDAARIIKVKQTKVVFMENVRNFATHDNGRTLKVIKNTITELGYSFSYKVLNSADYGIPQKRERIYMVCFRNNIDNKSFKFPEKKELMHFVEDFLLPDKDVQNCIIEKDDLKLNDNVKLKINLNNQLESVP